MRRALTAVAVAGIGIAACSHEPKTVAVDGTVFVVTNGGGSIKLGLVEVRAVRADSFQAYMRRRRADALVILGPIAERFVADSIAVHRVPKESERLAAHNPFAVFHTTPDGFEQKIDSLRRSEKAVSLEWGSIAPRHEEATSVSFYFAMLPPGDTAVKSDADGRFTLALRRDTRYVLVASALRQLAATPELHLWAVRVPDGGPTEHVMLSNDNEVESRDPTNAFPIDTVRSDGRRVGGTRGGQ